MIQTNLRPKIALTAVLLNVVIFSIICGITVANIVNLQKFGSGFIAPLLSVALFFASLFLLITNGAILIKSIKL